ncbi:hypothetical protein Tco_0246810 [Tanacetum coccineum]
MSSSTTPIPVDLAPAPRIIPHDTQVTVRKTVRPQSAMPLGYRAAMPRWRDAPLSTWYLLLPSELSSSSSELSSASSKTSPSLLPSSSLPPLSLLPSPSHKRSRFPSLPPLPSPPPTVLPPPPPLEVVIPKTLVTDTHVRLRKMVEAHCWAFNKDNIDTWRYQESESRYEIGEGSLAQIHPITDEPIHHTILLLVPRLVLYDGQIEEIHDHQREISAARSEFDERIEILEQELETVHSRVEASEAQTITTTNQGLSFAEIEQIIAQRVAIDIEAISIYETRTRVARDLMNQVEHQEDKVVENASNKRKWEGDHGGGSSQQQNKGHRVIRAHAAGPSNTKVYDRKLPHNNKCKFHHTGRCTAKCGNCKRVGHRTKNCRASIREPHRDPRWQHRRPTLPFMSVEY